MPSLLVNKSLPEQADYAAWRICKAYTLLLPKTAMATQPQPYPGGNASAEQVFRLAEEYRTAANALAKIARPGVPLSRAPFRLIAIHAIELYLNALLLIEGEKPCKVR
ncbi:MAG TPA: hypothetical protein VN004_16345, partial [Pseudorhodoplanes sp.]|nr:hypothetical protein [Pseudorhodoplanes sp.]